jgi:glycosyltransferase involved in cell wall biosynthesis
MPILSAIIPTHNRQRYAIDAITTILENFPDTEVVVSDTSDTRELETALAVWIKSGRLIYSHSSEMLDVVRNFENGLNLATGDYLIFLGDDDCLGPQAEQVAYWAASKNVDAVGCSLGAAYCWPDFRSKYFKDGYAAKLAIAPYDASISEVDGLAELQACLENLGAGPAKMPRAYLGMVSRELSQKMQAKYGSFFGGVSPDIYSAAMLSAECRKIVRLDFPFVLPGSSGASTSGQSASGGHKGKLRDNAHIGAFNNLVWDEAIPEFYSVQTVWSFSMLKAVERLSNSSLRPNYPRLYARCLMYHHKYLKETLHSIRYTAKKTGLLNMLVAIVAELFNETLFQITRISQRVRNPKATASSIVFENLPTIGDGYRELALYAKQSGKQLEI